MNIDEYRKLSPVEKDEWMFKMVLGFQQTLDKQTESMNLRVSSLETKMDTQVEEVKADVQEVNKSVVGLADRIGGLEKRTTDLENSVANMVADNADIKVENATFSSLPDGFMPGAKKITDKIDQRNQAMNNSMPWQSRAGARGGSFEEKPRVVASGSHTIHGGSLQQEDKVIKIKGRII